MNVPIVMPQMGQSMAEGTIVRWRKKVGEPVALDEVILEVESDKISIEVESPAAGRLQSCLKKEGEKAAVGEAIGLLATAAPAAEPPPVAPGGKPHAGADQPQVLVRADPDFGGAEAGALPELTRDWFSPYVLRLAMQNNISMEELQSLRGSGRLGRVTRTDLLQYLAQRPERRATAVPVSNEAVPEHLRAMGEVIPMTAIRRTIADHMVQSIHTSAHVTMVHAVEMTHIVELRDRIKDGFQQRFGVKMTYTTVMIFVTARVLRNFLTLNGSVHGSHIVRHNRINIGCAVALPDESLVVPVIQDADRKSFPLIAQDLDRLINLARRRELTRADVEGGTFTISNFGGFGSLIGTPIINQPQVAILGMGAVFKTPVVVNNQVGIRDQIYLSFTFDHRVIDGAMGGRFLNAIQCATEALNEQMLDVDQL
jgi:pyruvate/2-oxoglutarate dehydrogenase complex dihydrolipoamide acyltransferase (E2) component